MGLKLNLLNKNRLYIFIYVLILFGSFFINNFYISIFSSILIYLLILLVDIDFSIGIVFSLLSLSGIYDNSGFLYVFNFSIIVLFIKLLIVAFVQEKVNKNIIKCMAFVLILFVYELVNTIVNDVFSTGYFGNLTIWFGYFLLIIMSCYIKTIDKNKVFYMAYFGFILSCIFCFIQIYIKWGGNVPSVYRFVGLLRDPNYFSFTAILLLFSSLYLIRRKYKYIIACSVFILGMLSVSKMYILLCLVGAILYATYYFFLLLLGKIKEPMHFIYFMVGLILTLVILYLTGVIDLIMDKYIYRFETYDLTTGRDYIQGTFVNILGNDIQTLLFGRTLDYNKIFKVAYAENEAMVAHNTYLDLLMSFGALGTILYLFMMFNIVKLYISNIQVSCKAIILIVLFGVALFALSYLKADNFSICILFVLISISKNDGKEVLPYEKNNYVSSDTQTHRFYS